MVNWEGKISVRSLLMILILVVILISVIQTITVLSSVGNVDDRLSKETSTSGLVRLYVMPKPDSENAQVKLNVIKGGK